MDLPNFDDVFDWSLEPDKLRDIYKKTKFDSVFVKLISKNVITTLSPQLVDEPHNLVYDEDQVQKLLIGPLEKFICNSDDVDGTISYLKTLKQPSKLCRRILKTGDVLFSCNDCGYDGTCVVCIDCFHKSAHKDHNYRMSNTDGGGCCDCGDVEAWKQNYACSDHMADNQPNPSLSDFEDRESRSVQIQSDRKAISDKIGLLPKGISTRYFLVCQAALHYARTLLTWQDPTNLPRVYEFWDAQQDLDIEHLIDKDPKSKNYFTVLYNDEVHTYDHVISTLVSVVRCTKMTASIMASTVSREGRSFIFNDVRSACEDVQEKIENGPQAGQGPLKVDLLHGSVLAHQAFALKLIEWIQKMSLVCDAFRVLTAYTLLGTYDPIPYQEEDKTGDMTMLERIMLSNTTFWKMARVDWNDLFVTTLLTEYSIKEKFGRLVTRLYPKLVEYFIKDDHDHSVSILTMTTQLYTVPSLICMLIEEENALSIIAKTLVTTCSNTKREMPALSFEDRSNFNMQGLKRGFYIISDLRHLINIRPTKWTPELRKNVIQSVDIFLNLLNSMQGMDSVKRQIGQHIEYEPDWESGMTLQSRLISLISRLVTYCSFDLDVLVGTLKNVQTRLLSNRFRFMKKELFGYEASCIQYDVSTLHVSVHLPLTRFCAALIFELMKLTPCDKIPYDQSLVIFANSDERRHTMIEIMEPTLRTEVMIAQFRSGMWRRNGYSLVNQILYFHGALMRREMFDRDILLLQECAAMCDANEFMIHLLHKFQLFTWITSETTREPLVGPKAVSFHNDEENLAQTMSLGEELLQLLLTIVGERYRLGIGIIEESDVIKNEIIQLLCINPATRSELTQNLYVKDNELNCIKAVANLRRSTESSTGKYELKDEYYDRFNPFFYHYSRRHQSNALDAQLKRKKNLKESLICCPPPVPVELTKQFSNLNELLKCDITLILIQRILRRALGPPEDAQECSTKAPIRFNASDLQLDQCLHLIGLGLHEQERNPTTFRYLQAAHDKDIFPLLKAVYERTQRSKDLVFWLMRKTHNLTLVLDEKHMESLDEAAIRINSLLRECFKSALSTCDTTKQDSKQRNSELAAQRRERIMAMMKANQDKFLSNPTTKQLVAETEKTGPSAATRQRQQQPQQPAPSTSQSLSNQNYTRLRSGRKIMPPKSAEDNSASTATSTDKDVVMDGQNDDHMDSESINMESDEPAVASHLCILCRDEQKIEFGKPTMVLLAYIQRSAVLSQNRGERRIPNYALTPTNQYKHLTSSLSTIGTPDIYSYTSDNSWSFDATFMPADMFFGPHISTCGHVMHFTCWQGFFEAVFKRESRPNRSNRHVSFELSKSEILCPLCECISNATIPLLPDYTNFASRSGKLQTVFSARSSMLDKSSENLSAFLHALRGTVDVFKHIRHIKGMSTNINVNSEDKYIRLLQPKAFNDVLEKLNESENFGLRDFISSCRKDKILASSCTKDLLRTISKLAERIHTVGLDLDYTVEDVHHARIFMMNSWSIAYTIQAFERAQRFKGQPLFDDLDSSKNLCLSSLLRSTCSSMLIHQSDMLQSLLVRKLRYLLISQEHLSSSPCCLDIDVFETFVSLFILLQKLYAHVEDPNQLQDPNDATTSSSSSPKVGGSKKKLSEKKQQQQQQQLLSSSPSSSRNSLGEAQYCSWTTSNYDHEYYRNLLHLMLILNMLQVCITLQNDLSSSKTASEQSSTASGTADEASSPSSECTALYNFYREIILASGHPNNQLPTIDEKFTARVRNRLLPFMRSCAVFFYHLSHILPPEQLRNQSAFFDGKDFVNPPPSEEFVDAEQSFSTTSASETIISGDSSDLSSFDMDSSNEEFAAICNYLDLPNSFATLLHSQEVRHLARSWLRHSRVLVLIKSALSEQESWSPSSSYATTNSGEQPANTSGGHQRATINQQQQQQQLKRVASSQALTPASAESSAPTDNDSLPGSSAILSMLSQAGMVTSNSMQTELMPVKFIRQPHTVNRLVDLPYDYSELVDKVSDFTCPSIKNEDSRTPTMCLICGVMLCSQSYCCQRDLNNLALNYQQILQLQQLQRRLAATIGSSRTEAHQTASSSGAGSSQPGAHTGPMGASTAALNFMRSAAALMVSPNPGVPAPAHQQHPAPLDDILNPNRRMSASEAAALGLESAASQAVIHQQLVGSCTYHAHECSGGVGIFLRVRTCQILLLSGRSKGCYMPAPYIDDHGETDFGLMRGNPLHLNRQHYEKLQHLWLTHSIPEQISRTLEYSHYASHIHWHLH